jgi:hypothetical protein
MFTTARALWTYVYSLPLLLSLAPVCLAQESAAPATLTPGDNLIIQNIPATPLSIAEQAGRYTEFRTAAPFSWHPQRREMLIGTRFGDTVQVHEIKMPGGARRQLTFFPDRVSGASFHPGKGDYFIFSKDSGGGEWFQIFRFDPASGNSELLTDGKSRNLGSVWSNQGDHIAYASTRRNRADLDFYIMNPADKSTDRLLTQTRAAAGASRIGLRMIRSYSRSKRFPSMKAISGSSMQPVATKPFSRRKAASRSLTRRLAFRAMAKESMLRPIVIMSSSALLCWM